MNCAPASENEAGKILDDQYATRIELREGWLRAVETSERRRGRSDYAHRGWKGLLERVRLSNSGSIRR